MTIKAPNFLYHYTTIDTLEKILSTKQIRFNRLDQVNDANEGKSLDFGDLGLYIFVSCWTDSEQEIIPLWQIYSDHYTGVRIKLPTKMFKDYAIKPQLERAFFTDPDFRYPKKREDIHGKDYIMAPIPVDFPSKIIYTEEFKNIIPDVGDTYDSNLIHMGKLGVYKRKEWAYEKEWRFMLRIMPAPPPPKKSYLEYKDNFDLLVQEQFIKREVSINSIFLDLDEQSLQQMEMTIGPHCSEKLLNELSDILIDNNLDISIKQSSLSNQIK